MIIEDRKEYTLLTLNENSFEEFTTVLGEKHVDLIDNHIIIQISDKINVIEKDIFVLLKYSELHQNNNTSFIVVCKNVDADDFPETFNIVPTFIEAEDVLEMENIQRELEF